MATRAGTSWPPSAVLLLIHCLPLKGWVGYDATDAPPDRLSDIRVCLLPRKQPGPVAGTEVRGDGCDDCEAWPVSPADGIREGRCHACLSPELEMALSLGDQQLSKFVDQGSGAEM